MFENKSNRNDQSTSSTSRDQSPNGSVYSANDRPVSKVRTSFVAVERPGEPGQPPQLGLREASDMSSMAEVREEATVEDGNATVAPEVTPAETASEGGDELGAILKGSAFENTQHSVPPVTQNEIQPEQDSNKKESEQDSDKKEPEQPQVNGTSKEAHITGNMESQPASKLESAQDKDTTPKKSTPAKINTKPSTTRSKESPVVPKKSPVVQKDANSSRAMRPRGGVSKIQGIINSSNKAKEERARIEQAEASKAGQQQSSKAVKPPSVASKPTAASKAHAARQDSVPQDQVQPKSPTSTRIPAKLPSAATATTSASAARKGASTGIGEAKSFTTEKKTTAANQAPRVAHTSTRTSLAKKTPRASLTNGDELPRSRLSTTHKPADESFLARMTRPTASSAQKAHDKIQVSSPPRQSKTSGPRKSRKSLNAAAQNSNGEPSADESILEAVNEAAEKALEETTVEAGNQSGLIEEQGAPNPPQQTAVADNTS